MAIVVSHAAVQRQYRAKKFIDKAREPAVAAVNSLLEASQHLTRLKTKFDGRVSTCVLCPIA